MQNQYFVTHSLLNRGILRPAAGLFLAAMLAALAGCGSGSSGGDPAAAAAAAASGSGGTTVVTTPTASVQLLASSPQIDSSGAKTVDLTAVVLSSTKQAISGKTVTFSTGSDTTAFINNVSSSGVSDNNGVVSAKLNIGTNKANRTITVTATADAAVGTNTVDVTGTTVAVSGNDSLTTGTTTTLTFSVKDSAGTAIPGVTVGVTSLNKNTIVLNPSTGITGGTGTITATITGAVGGSDTITATAAGATATQALSVSPDSFAFTTPAASTDILLGATPTIAINWTNSSTAVPAGTGVAFSATRGTITTPLGGAVTDAAGNTPGVTISSALTAGPAIITASGLSGNKPAATLDVIFVATSASTVTVQAVPGVIAYTTGSSSQTNNSSTISVIVRDSNENLVKNASVDFTILKDPTSGRLTSSNVTTGVSGTASVTYIAGQTSSASNGVQIQATVTKVNGAAIAPVTGTTTLTVAGQANLVLLGTDNLVGGTAPVNTKTYVALVTDTAKNPVVGATVVFSLRPARFSKGIYVQDLVNNVWVQVVKATCANEDTNFDGIIQTGEDISGNGKLDPGGAATVNATAVTDDAGKATATITYPKDHSWWAEVTLEARTGVSGNDPPTTTTFFLPGLATDYNNINVSPPGQTSPYGAGNSPLCTNNN